MCTRKINVLTKMEKESERERDQNLFIFDDVILRLYMIDNGELLKYFFVVKILVKMGFINQRWV